MALAKARACARGLIDAWIEAESTAEREAISAVIAEVACPGATRSLVDQAFAAMRAKGGGR